MRVEELMGVEEGRCHGYVQVYIYSHAFFFFIVKSYRADLLVARTTLNMDQSPGEFYGVVESLQLLIQYIPHHLKSKSKTN